MNRVGKIYRKKTFYIVRLRKDDSIVAVGDSYECARRMGMSLSVFYTTVSRSRSGELKKYEIDAMREEDNA